MMDRFYKALTAMAPAPQSTQLQPKPPGPPAGVVENQLPTGMQMPQPSQSSPPAQPRLAHPPATQQIAKGARKPGLASTPSPAAHTPAPAAPTPPTASSPRTPKSPPKKAVARSKPPPKRRVSKAGQQPPDIGPSKLAGTKRARDDEPTPQGNALQADTATDEPSPKRLKRVDWDGPPNEDLEKRQQEVDNLETKQDVQAYLARATEDFLVSGEGSEGPSDDLPKTLQELFKGVPIFEVPDSFPGPSAESSTIPSSPKPSDNALDLLDFFDFSQCEPDEPVASTSKIDTPDLVHASSTNPSPESAAETPGRENGVIASSRAKDAIKIEDIGVPNPLALSVWAEIKGGEPAYFDHPSYKWEGDMQVLDVPWAMSAGT